MSQVGTAMPPIVLKMSQVVPTMPQVGAGMPQVGTTMPSIVPTMPQVGAGMPQVGALALACLRLLHVRLTRGLRARPDLCAGGSFFSVASVVPDFPGAPGLVDAPAVPAGSGRRCAAVGRRTLWPLRRFALYAFTPRGEADNLGGCNLAVCAASRPPS